jgi:histidyl-tRNA synthetase
MAGSGSSLAGTGRSTREMKALIPSVKGTRDFYPEQLALRNWLYEHMRRVALAFGYQEYDGPFLETLQLYAAKSGEELVKEQAFVFKDRGGEQVALRPELTPSLARMIAERQSQLVVPIRWWSFGPFWRYEQPQKGRSREFFQWNVDLLGVASAEADAELVAMAAEFFRAVGLTPAQVRIQVNHRQLMDLELERLAIGSEARRSVLQLVDRRDRLSAAEWRQRASEAGLGAEQLEGLLRLLENRELWRNSAELARLLDAVAALGAADYVEFNPAVVRGLDYYTGTVFEARDPEGELRALLGGGRYDDLVGEVGGKKLPGVGFAMGDVVLGLLLTKHGLLPSHVLEPAQVLVTSFGLEQIEAALKLCVSLRSGGLHVEWYPESSRLPKQLKYADQRGIPYVVILGADEMARGVVALRDMRARNQVELAAEQLPAEIERRLAGRESP